MFKQQVLRTVLITNLNNKLRFNFHPLEVVCRGSETQLQVGGNLR